MIFNKLGSDGGLFIVIGKKKLKITLINFSFMDFFKELWNFFKIRKKWWLLPIILFLALLDGL